MVSTAIILAGGMGTRLQHIVNDVPKPMAPIAGKPFLARQLEYLARQGIKTVVLAVSHKRHVIELYFGTVYYGLELVYSVEETPLGTGGGIQHAFEYVTEDSALVLNGDSVFICDLNTVFETHFEKKADITLALKRMYNFERYGTVHLNGGGYVDAFLEKQPCKEGLINTGVYIIDKRVFDSYTAGSAFSFEKDVLEQDSSSLRVAGCELDGYFIDIGIPEDFNRAQTEIPLYLS